MGVTVQVWVQWPLHSPDLVRLRVSITHFSSPFSYNMEVSGQDWFNDWYIYNIYLIKIIKIHFKNILIFYHMIIKLPEYNLYQKVSNTSPLSVLIHTPVHNERINHKILTTARLPWSTNKYNCSQRHTYIFTNDSALCLLVTGSPAPFVAWRTALVLGLLSCHSTLGSVMKLEVTPDGPQIVERVLTFG